MPERFPAPALDAVARWRFQPQPAVIQIPVEFHQPSKFSRWHLIGAKFDPSEGVSRPTFVRANYPRGVGISPQAYEEGRLLGAIGRPANVSLAFDIDDHGKPEHFEVVKASYDLWGFEAANLVADWQFAPGTKDGVPVPVRCTADLVWGAETLSTATLAQQLDALHPVPMARPAPPWAPVVLEQSPPTCTDQARAAGLEGALWVSFNVGADGVPQEIKVTEPLGLGLDDQAVQAISNWRYKPAQLNGQPIAAPAVVEVIFQLNGVTVAMERLDMPAPARAAQK